MDKITFSNIPTYEIARAQYLSDKGGQAQEDEDPQKHEEVRKDLVFEKACDLYKKDLEKHVLDAIKRLVKSGKHVPVNFELRSKQYKIDDKVYPAHVIHYGVHKPNTRYWSNRNPKTWERRGVPHPFKEAQKELASKGYYLQDISDPGKSFDIYIVLGSEAIQGEPLWHGLNIIPQ